MVIEVRQALLDREMAPVLDWCSRCGGEIYSLESLEQGNGLCPACLRRYQLEEELYGGIQT
ncbi:MAG: hypothetical protein IKP19_05405 [Oscillospiraceae bacterium]|nr:hypothetical protein [Oscillospiraceae bacterium]